MVIKLGLEEAEVTGETVVAEKLRGKTYAGESGILRAEGICLTENKTPRKKVLAGISSVLLQFKCTCRGSFTGLTRFAQISSSWYYRLNECNELS